MKHISQIHRNPEPRPVSTETRGLLAMPPLIGRRIPPSLRQSAGQIPPAAYRRLIRDSKETYKISVRKWRRHMSGMAYELLYDDGSIKRLISAPRPRSPVSAAIFLHEVGHHAIGFRRYGCRCLEEYYVWQWTFREMTGRRIPITDRVLRHYHRSMHHYVRLARKNGLRELPAQLHAFVG